MSSYTHLNDLSARAAEDELDDCETDPEAVVILVVIILVVLALMFLGYYLWKRAKARTEGRTLRWQDLVPSWLRSGSPPALMGPEMAHYGSTGIIGPGLVRKGSSASDYSINTGNFMQPHAPYSSTGYPQHSGQPGSGFGASGYVAQSDYGGSDSPYQDPGSGYGLSGYTSRSASRKMQRLPATPLGRGGIDYDDAYSINSYGSDDKRSVPPTPRTPRTPRTPATPVSARQRALNDAWARARHGSGSRPLDTLSEADEEARHYRSGSRSRRPRY